MSRIARIWPALVLLAVLACGSPEPTVPDDDATPAPSRAAQGQPGAPNIVITTPANGSTVEGGNVKVRVDVERFDLTREIGGSAAAGEGHIHYYLDAENIPTTPGAPAILPEESRYHVSAKRSYTWKDVSQGVHTFSVQLVNNDMTPLEPPITAATTVTVERAADDSDGADDGE